MQFIYLLTNFLLRQKCLCVDNPVDMMDIAKRFSFQVILNGTLSVDTFFLLRSVLICISFAYVSHPLASEVWCRFWTCFVYLCRFVGDEFFPDVFCSRSFSCWGVVVDVGFWRIMWQSTTYADDRSKNIYFAKLLTLPLRHECGFSQHFLLLLSHRLRFIMHGPSPCLYTLHVKFLWCTVI